MQLLQCFAGLFILSVGLYTHAESLLDGTNVSGEIEMLCGTGN